ncbi:MAG: HAMP domain-containing sensor histidine kinase [Tissierellia bacterium]|nr:HAMP domain-containing sensor histidine kinase [Tissierellia bacterium]
MKRELKEIDSKLKDRIIGDSYFKLSVDFAPKEIDRLNHSLNLKLEEYDKKILKLSNEARLNKINITNISHDLRTPLTSIKGYLALYEKASEEERLKYLKIIEQKTNEMHEKLDAFYAYSQIISNDIMPQTESKDLIAIIREEILNYFDEFEKQNQDLKLNLPDEKYIINTDEMLFRRILDNILSNMLKYSEGSNEITVNIDSNFSIEFKNKADLSKIEDINILLDRSFTMDSSRSKRSTGLGLSIVKELSEKLGFELELKKDDSHFYILIFKN